jgi:hypothetical protein
MEEVCHGKADVMRRRLEQEPRRAATAKKRTGVVRLVPLRALYTEVEKN